MELRELDHSSVDPVRGSDSADGRSGMSGSSGTATGTANSSRSADSLLPLLRSELRLGQVTPGFDRPFPEDFLCKVQQKKNLEGLLHKQALCEALLDRIIEYKGTLEAALLFILDVSETEGEACQLMDAVFSRGVDLGTRDEPYLHKAAKRNFVHAARTLIDNKVKMDKPDATDHRLPVIIALEAKYDEMASVIIRRMPKESIRKLFEDTDNPMESFQNMVNEGKMPLSCRAVLDACLNPTDEPDEYRFYYRILESDPKRRAPSDDSFSNDSKTGFHRVLECKDKELQRHPVVRMLIYNKWAKYGEHMAVINLGFHVIFMVVVTSSLVWAGTQADPHVYDSNGDYGRAVLEILSLLAMCFSLLTMCFPFVKFKREKLGYFKDVNNYIQLGSIFLLFAIIPLRFTNVDAQWHVAAFAYVFLCMRILRLISVTRIVGIYPRILNRILYKDITRFGIIFGIFLVTYSGSLFFALRGARVPVADPGMNMTASTDPKVTTEFSINHFTSLRHYGLIILSGLRTMIEQASRVDYLNDAPVSASFSWLGFVINMVFLFFVLVVLLNILIAQLSDTYADVKADAQRELEQNWATYLRKFEQTSLLRRFKRYRFRKYVDYEDVTNPGQRIIGWEEPTNVDEDEEEKRRQCQMASDIEKQGQQMMARKSQMRTALELLYANKKVTRDIDVKIRQLANVQVPEAVNDIIGQTESTLRSDVAQSQKQQSTHYDNLSTAAQGHAERITQLLQEGVTSTQELVNQLDEATALRIDSVKDSLAEAIPQYVSEMRKAVDDSEKRIISMLEQAVVKQIKQLKTEVRLEVTLLKDQFNSRQDSLVKKVENLTDIMDRSPRPRRQDRSPRPL